MRKFRYIVQSAKEPFVVDGKKIQFTEKEIKSRPCDVCGQYCDNPVIQIEECAYIYDDKPENWEMSDRDLWLAVSYEKYNKEYYDNKEKVVFFGHEDCLKTKQRTENNNYAPFLDKSQIINTKVNMPQNYRHGNYLSKEHAMECGDFNFTKIKELENEVEDLLHLTWDSDWCINNKSGCIKAAQNMRAINYYKTFIENGEGCARRLRYDSMGLFKDSNGSNWKYEGLENLDYFKGMTRTEMVNLIENGDKYRNRNPRDCSKLENAIYDRRKDYEQGSEAYKFGFWIFVVVIIWLFAGCPGLY